MSLDMSQFVPTFLEESSEGLEVMESSLLALDADDGETINAIFRAAHSIKGGAGTFGFTALAEFTHHVETLLDQLRSGRRQAAPALVDLLLEAVDAMRLLLQAARDGDSDAPAPVAKVRQGLEAALAVEPTAAPPVSSPATVAASDQGWLIRFVPDPGLLQTGNEPLLMFDALAELGPLQVRPDCGRLPALEALEPEQLYLAWELELHAACGEDEIREIFEWVEDECDLQIMPLQPAAAPASERVAAWTPAQDDRAPVAARPPAPVAKQDSGSIRVAIDKVDALINRVGELVITQAMLGQLGQELAGLESEALERLQAGLAQLERNTRELQEDVMRVRMLPVSFVFNRFPRLVHDVGAKLGKEVELRLHGEQTELDKTVLEKIGDPLMHLVRNALDHGLEMPAERLAAGKDSTGLVQLNAYHQGGFIVIEISDDGRGLDGDRIFRKAVEKGLVAADAGLSEQAMQELIFLPGFSTAEQVSDLSGRGVGMDVVRRNIEALGGHVSLASAVGRGSTFSVRLPLTLAILDGQLVRVGRETCIVPLVSIIETLQTGPQSLNRVAGAERLLHFRDEYIPLLRLGETFGLDSDGGDNRSRLVVVVEAGERRAGLVVDELLGQQQVVIKSLESNFRRVEGLAGATILGDGRVALILDVAGLVKRGPDARPGAADGGHEFITSRAGKAHDDAATQQRH
ncbi:chemotaxis protein CheA [Marinobacterium aestuariivivens]|uniref:Chemotaxis protein CheA n=1 Tax=Marinobacterium aestuariivivens TaxID=1698799 RepID=A0ABW1ZX95_9GAMM